MRRVPEETYRGFGSSYHISSLVQPRFFKIVADHCFPPLRPDMAFSSCVRSMVGAPPRLTAPPDGEGLSGFP